LKRNNIEFSGIWRKEKNNWSIEGDPTEGALIVVAAKFDIWRSALEKEYQKLNEIPFESSRAKMSVVYKKGTEHFLITKGAPDEIIKLCKRYVGEFGDEILDEKTQEKIINENEYMTKDALRVLAVAYKKVAENDLNKIDDKIENDLTFAGLIGMIDPARTEAKKAIEVCKLAKIRPIMITGDHPNTAMAIAKELKICDEKRSGLLTGQDIDKLTLNELTKHIENTNVYARVSPFHKLRIVQCLKKSGYIVAMTGDGVNDAPAVKEANIGICMGKNGTDVTKESSDMILIDDNFSTIVAAVEEGRSIYENIRKFIRYLLACNTGEVLTMLIASLINLPLPLLPVQILWVNLITDGLPALALGVDKNGSDIMCRPPRSKNEGIFSKGLSKKIIIKGIQIGFSTILVFSLVLFSKHDLELARTMALTTLVFSQIFHVFDCRSEYLNCIEAGILKNKYLIGAVTCSVLMHIAVIYHPFFNNAFSTVAITFEEWLIILLISGWNFVINVFQYIFSHNKVLQKVFSK
jgi:Ca2+-transporting ATPase